MSTGLRRRLQRKFRLVRQGRLKCLEAALPLVQGKTGIEIGGPSTVFRSGWSREYGWSSPLPVYDRVGSLDNCNFARDTLWSSHGESFRFSAGKRPGKVIIADGSDLFSIADQSYDFVLSSHNLEHFANPMRALLEWKRVTRPNGGLVLVLPDYRRTFDHRRHPTPVQHMLDDYRASIGEEDLSHVPEVLALHDLSMDGTLQTGQWEELASRSRDNFHNRVLHHHVFDELNSAGLLLAAGLRILALELALPHHIVIVGQWSEADMLPDGRAAADIHARQTR